jgi:hypothetical protein
VIALVCWPVSVLLLWGQLQARVLHPWSLLFLALLALTALGAVGGGLAALWRMIFGPGRRAALTWLLAAAVPLSFWLGLGGYARAMTAGRAGPNNLPMRLATMAAASVMEAQANHTYPHRLEGERLVMYYDDRVTQPQRDLAAMEQHVARLEALTGKPLRAKIYWVRGKLLGYGRMACYGLALGSTESPDDWETAGHPDRLSVDRHELAHAVLHQMYPADTDPPMLLVEGWADAQAGPTADRMARWAWESRERWLARTREAPRSSYLRELTSSGWYHRIASPVYDVGGAFADFLLREFGVERFLALYFACQPGTFEQEVQAKLGVDLDTLEAQFWKGVETRVRGEKGERGASAP